MHVVFTFISLLLILIYPFFYTFFLYVIVFLYMIFFFKKIFLKEKSTLYIQYNFTNIGQYLWEFFKNFKLSFLAFIFHYKSKLPLLTIVLKPFQTFRWKPLFKKTSYFGLYRANRVQWSNKTEENFK